jgi:heme-degrading monooxygenase HmoA
VIARTWHGAVPIEKSDKYLELMRNVAIPDYKATPGNRGAYVLLRKEGDIAHFIMLTYWDSLDAVRTFAGEDVTAAKYYDFDVDYLIELEPTAVHHQVFDNSTTAS